MSIFFCFFGENLFISLSPRTAIDCFAQNISTAAHYHIPAIFLILPFLSAQAPRKRRLLKSYVATIILFGANDLNLCRAERAEMPLRPLGGRFNTFGSNYCRRSALRLLDLIVRLLAGYRPLPGGRSGVAPGT